MSQAEDRTPGIRKAATAEELAGLSKFERGAVRAFEFLASVRLAIFSLTWLGIECIAGALIESQMNTYSAWYLVYGNTRFHLCIGFLALNILCAALIRFPWKRYQTGFVVTHIGLLTLIFGSMLTLRDQLDCLMVVAKGESEGESVWKSAMFDNDRERIEIVEFNPETGTPKATQSIPVNMGPFTWGHKIFGLIPWRDGYVESHKLDAGGELRIKNFWANCQRVPTYVAAEKNIPGRPAALVKIQLPKGDQLFSEWVEFPKAASRQGPGSHSVGNFGAVLAWSAGSALEFDHFLGALPREIPEAAVADGAEGGGLLGWLKVERAGKTHRFRVDDLRRGKPIAIPDTGETIEVTEYFPDAKPGPKPGTLTQGSDEPKNPGLKVRI
ncbi:MAG TPA: hypothetical protein VNC50_02685, partial [Planctomycetia bacterium]|nr:hypothetical protein [Planctomycetia bacterium]